MKADATDINYKQHHATPEQCSRHDIIRRAARTFAETITEQTPGSEEQSLALRKVQEAVFWAKGAIQLNEGEIGTD